MAARDDDDALTWEGDDDSTLHGADALPPGYRAVGRGSDGYAGAPETSGASAPTPADATSQSADAASRDADDAADENESQEGPGMGNAMLVTLGVLAGVYLLYSIGWVLGGRRLELVAQLFLEPIGFTAAWVLAIAAPAIWFVTAFVLTRGGRSWVRLVALLAGAVVLVPWPFLMPGALA